MRNESTMRQVLEQCVSRTTFLVILFLILITVLVSSGTELVSAQQATPSDDEVNAIARKLYCPICENIPLDVCQTQACEQWREEIRLRLAQGWTEEEILQDFAYRHGTRVLAQPPPTGLHWLVYVVPPVVFLAGAVLLFMAFRSWRKLGKQPAEHSEPEMPKDEYVDRVEEELRKRGRS